MQLTQLPDLLYIGIVFLVGWLAHVVGSKTHIPRITLLISIGVISGPYVLDLVPMEMNNYFSTIAHLALAMIGFLLGESFMARDFQIEKRQILYVSIGATLAPAVVVFVFIYLVSSDIVLSLVLGGIATATDPAATIDVIREVHARGSLTRMLKSVVAIDDALGMIIFSLVFVVANMLSGNGVAITDISYVFLDIGGSILLGIAVAFPMSMVVGRARDGEPTLVEAMGFVFVCGGLALLFDLSYLLACMTLGAALARKAKFMNRPFHEIEEVSEPFMIMFFLLSGLNLDLASLKTFGTIGLVYILARSIGKILGANFFARLASSPQIVQKHLGWCLLPQAGIAIGMALLISERLPDIGAKVLSIAVASTVFFELLGPLFTRWHLNKSGEGE